MLMLFSLLLHLLCSAATAAAFFWRGPVLLGRCWGHDLLHLHLLWYDDDDVLGDPSQLYHAPRELVLRVVQPLGLL